MTSEVDFAARSNKAEAHLSGWTVDRFGSDMRQHLDLPTAHQSERCGREWSRWRKRRRDDPTGRWRRGRTLRRQLRPPDRADAPSRPGRCRAQRRSGWSGGSKALLIVQVAEPGASGERSGHDETDDQHDEAEPMELAAISVRRQPVSATDRDLLVGRSRVATRGPVDLRWWRPRAESLEGHLCVVQSTRHHRLTSTLLPCLASLALRPRSRRSWTRTTQNCRAMAGQ